MALCGATLKLSADGGNGEPVAQPTISLQAGIYHWWDECHVQICNKSLDLACFMAAIGTCVLAGAGGPLAAVVAGALIGGKPVVEALKAHYSGKNDSRGVG